MLTSARVLLRTPVPLLAGIGDGGLLLAGCETLVKLGKPMRELEPTKQTSLLLV